MKPIKQRYQEQKSIKMSDEDKAIAGLLYTQGFHVKRIAALFDVNQGRISEVISKFGLKVNK